MSNPATDEENAQLWAWMRSRPPEVQALMRVFPPSCRVRIRPELAHKALKPGTVAQVLAYTEGGVLWVVDIDDGGEGHTSPDTVEVTEYMGNVTPEWVARVLAGEDAAVELEDWT